MENYATPICSVCTRDWDVLLGYCEPCADREAALRVKRNIIAAAGMLEDNFS